VPAFADTNVVVYAFAKDEAKVAIAEGILEKQPTISVHVISEFLNVCRTKLGMDLPTRHKLAGELIAGCNVVALDPRVIEKAMDVEAPGEGISGGPGGPERGLDGKCANLRARGCSGIGD